MYGSRSYPSPHQSPELDMGKSVMNEQHWGSGSSTWGYKQQRSSPSPSVQSTMGEYSAFSSPEPSSYGGDYQEHSYMSLMQNAPLTPPVSEGYSPELSQQGWGSHTYEIKDEAVTGLQILDHPLGIDAYGLMRLQEHTPPLESNKRSLGGLFPDVSGGQMQRKKRRLTEPAEANYHCSICGKYFSRVWNYNAHRETHDPSRPKPHICQAEGCGKAFVRRTDLTRHIQCVCFLSFYGVCNSLLTFIQVHAKDKKFQCSLCNNRFARKDTLRRYVYISTMISKIPRTWSLT